MVGRWSRMSLRLENLAGMVCPKEPIGPDGGGSLEALIVPDAGGCWPPVPVVVVPEAGCCGLRRPAVSAPPPADGCREMGWTRAAQASAGAGILSTSADLD